MKKLLTYSAAIIAACAALVSCNKEQAFIEEPAVKTHSISFIADQLDTKTSMTIEDKVATFKWEDTDAENVFVYEDETPGNVSADFDENKLIVLASFDGDVPASPVYYAYVNDDIRTQVPTDKSYDSAADVLVAEPFTQADRSGDEFFSPVFSRKVAVNKMTVKGLVPGAIVEEVTITSDQDIAGKYVKNTWTEKTSTLNIMSDEIMADESGNAVVYFTCLPVENANLIIDVTTDEGCFTKQFASNITFTEGAIKSFGVTVSSIGASTDKFTSADFAATTTTYTEFSGVKKNYAVYAGKTSKNANGAIQVRSNNSDTGIVTTTSGGNLQSISVTWNSTAVDGRTLEIYGKNTPYTNAADLFNADSRGTRIGTIVKGTSSSLNVPNGVRYKYVGIRSKENSCPLDDITIEWDIVAPMESCATPWASVNPGAIERGTEIALTTTTTDAEIYYTLNGDEPTISSTHYTDPVVINQACTLKAIAVAEGKRNSAVKALSYTILKCATPVSDFASGALASGTEVSLSCSTDGASIYYTTDGSTPTSSSTLYSGKITVTEAMTLKAIAIKANYDDSDVDSWVFTISTGGTTEYTATWTASSGGFGTSGKAASSFTDSQNNTWAISIDDATYLGWSSSCIQVGSRNNPTNLTLSTSDITGIIKSITVSCYSYNGAHTYSFTIGGSEVATGSTSSTIEDIVYSTETAAGPITISFDKNSGRALYIKGITVVYEK